MKLVFGRTLSEKDCIPGQRQCGAKFALIILTCINLLNFADRYVTSAVKELIKEDMNLTDTETALPTTGMVIVYVISAASFGVLADKQLIDRRYVLCAAIVFWSVATAAAGLAQTLEQLIVLRSLVGVGEAAYSTIAPPLIADFFPPQDRNVAFSIYFLAIPVGAAVGFGLGAVLGDMFNWRVAFLGVGLPGIAVSLCVLLCNNPVHGLNDTKHASHTTGVEVIGLPATREGSECSCDREITANPLSAAATVEEGGECHDSGCDAELMTSDRSLSNCPTPSSESSLTRLRGELCMVLSNKVFAVATAGTVANTFALGGLAEWFPAYLSRFYGADIGESGLVVGAATILGGIGGCVLGAKTAQYFEPLVKSSFFLVCAVYTLPAAAFLAILINAIPADMVAAAYCTLMASEVFVWTSLAPMFTVALNAIPPDLRATSCGLSIVLQHVLGDMISPPIIGGISDETGSLRSGLQITWVMVLVSGVVWWAGYYYLPPQPLGMHPLSAPSSSGSPDAILGIQRISEGTHRSNGSSRQDTTFYELLCVRTTDDNR